ncbi:serine/threonine-protein kinase [Streptomyces sp. AJS327]|uniref:serine/threonine-protein kinase n=1 Tax=Streptomyces sp. AJS327 TaxID=2545265 RepID=UPI0015DDCDD2|nr:serine/threonine-protein kinase [Streptomyces sp. AJS327]
MLIAGRYELVKRIGRGGMGEVWVGRDRDLYRDVALKLLVTDEALPEDVPRRFEREAVAAAQVNHPNVVALYDRGVHEDLLYLVMEWVDGRTLAEHLNPEHPMGPARALRIAEEVCAALVAAHQARVIHYDIKPHNIMLTTDGDRTKVVDFGIAGFIHNTFTLARSSQLAPAGTAEYGAPEQFQTERGDARSDLYALGGVLFALLAGRPPFTGHNGLAVVRRKLDEDAPRVSEYRPDLPGGVVELVEDLLRRDPDDRPRSAAVVYAALRRLRAQLPGADASEAVTVASGRLRTGTPDGNVDGGGEGYADVDGDAEQPPRLEPVGLPGDQLPTGDGELVRDGGHSPDGRREFAGPEEPDSSESWGSPGEPGRSGVPGGAEGPDGPVRKNVPEGEGISAGGRGSAGSGGVEGRADPEEPRSAPAPSPAVPNPAVPSPAVPNPLGAGPSAPVPSSPVEGGPGARTPRRPPRTRVLPPPVVDSFEMAWSGRERLADYASRTSPPLWQGWMLLLCVAGVTLVSAVLPLRTGSLAFGPGQGDNPWLLVTVIWVLGGVWTIRLAASTVPSTVKSVRETLGFGTRPSWSLRIDQDGITTTDASKATPATGPTGRRTWPWSHVRTVTMEHIRGRAPHRYSGLHIRYTSDAPSTVSGHPAGWTHASHPATRRDGSAPLCVLGPLTERQRAELTDALARHAGRRWRPGDEASRRP